MRLMWWSTGDTVVGRGEDEDDETGSEHALDSRSIGRVKLRQVGELCGSWTDRRVTQGWHLRC